MVHLNAGSKTKGTDGLTIRDYKVIDEDKFVKSIQESLASYHPKMVRRVMIPKDNGKERPLGIPTMRDRIIQQMFKQILEPIVEAKFHNHSYGFRPNRSQHYAMARSAFLINMAHLHYVVDVDIAGFFDNVDHRKLINQLYNIGIKDKRVLTLINRMLKAEIEGEGVPTKGTPQGGILSPLLSNVVLNDLDWWVSNQWETFETKKKFTTRENKMITLKKKSNLKPMFIVRFADDFKIFTNTHENAQKIYVGVKDYLQNQLHLEISPEKSKITNLRKRKSDFLGFEIKAVKKGKKYVAHTNVMKSKKQKILKKGRELVQKVKKRPNAKNVNLFNSWVLGIHNYNRIATHVSIDFSRIAYCLNRTMYIRFKSIGKYSIPEKPNRTYKKFYGKNNYKTWLIKDIYIYPIADVKVRSPKGFTQSICNYTQEGREKIFKKIEDEVTLQIHKMMKSYIPNRSIEYLDNRISKYSMQKGKCHVTGIFLLSHEVHCHHIKAVKDGGDDSFRNLVIMHEDIHKLIHATNDEIIAKYSKGLNTNHINKINKLRESLELKPIIDSASDDVPKVSTEQKNEKDSNPSRSVTY